jgi:prophage regulatory protein
MEQAILREKDVIKFVGLSRTSIWRKERAGLFPARVHLGGGRAIGWRRSDLEAWIQSLKGTPATVNPEARQEVGG